MSVFVPTGEYLSSFTSRSRKGNGDGKKCAKRDGESKEKLLCCGVLMVMASCTGGDGPAWRNCGGSQMMHGELDDADIVLARNANTDVPA